MDHLYIAAMINLNNASAVYVLCDSELHASTCLRGTATTTTLSYVMVLIRSGLSCHELVLGFKVAVWAVLGHVIGRKAELACAFLS